ncbi:MAG: hypothetical protein ABIJ00_13805 [Candidatus Eisenbacteria bacterium]
MLTELSEPTFMHLGLRSYQLGLEDMPGEFNAYSHRGEGLLNLANDDRVWFSSSGEDNRLEASWLGAEELIKLFQFRDNYRNEKLMHVLVDSWDVHHRNLCLGRLAGVITLYGIGLAVILRFRARRRAKPSPIPPTA